MGTMTLTELTVKTDRVRELQADLAAMQNAFEARIIADDGCMDTRDVKVMRGEEAASFLAFYVGAAQAELQVLTEQLKNIGVVVDALDSDTPDVADED